MPRQEKVRVPIDEIRRTLEDLDGRRIQNRARGGSGPPRQNTRRARQEPVRVSPDEVRRTLEDLERRNARGRPPRRQKVTVTEDELARTMAAITRQHAEERSQARAARLRRQEQADEHGRQGLGDAPRTPPPATPEEIVPAPHTPPPTRPVPHTPLPRKRLGEPQLEGLLTPPPTRPVRPQKRPRPSQDTAPAQRRSLETILQYHESRFRDKEKESVARSWCKEVPLALQVETAKFFHQAFADERTLPILHCNFCYRKQPPSELTTIRWKRHLAASLLRAMTAL
ncbi:hypothetical protein B0T10DRAFT_138738 [Thelonectria olida]|uniref:Uncharacterized protein n=1 Tax=Thelonectria olida TaxID=1576542 RepID=A0A9P8VZS4_9HYPO|nr:hypothetical protein B0T10DRAFT_138738 [Thelonectria olida]